jgi:hypothetical protein
MPSLLIQSQRVSPFLTARSQLPLKNRRHRDTLMEACPVHATVSTYNSCAHSIIHSFRILHVIRIQQSRNSSSPCSLFRSRLLLVQLAVVSTAKLLRLHRTLIYILSRIRRQTTQSCTIKIKTKTKTNACRYPRCHIFSILKHIQACDCI